MADGSNIEKLHKAIKEGADEVESLKEQRQSINDKIQAVRSNLEAKGIKKESFDMALRYMSWDEDKREGFDIAYGIVREALGAPVKDGQLELPMGDEK